MFIINRKEILVILPIKVFMEKDLEKLIHEALKEDGYEKDLTSTAIIDLKKEAVGNFIVKTPGIISGVTIVEEVYRQINPRVKVNILKDDGDYVNKGDVVVSISGKMIDILRGERVALNFLQIMSGVATLTDKYAQELKGTECVIVDSGKVIPLLRKFENQAVYHGNGLNYIQNLNNQIIIKDYHILIAGSISDAVEKVRIKNGYDMFVDVEVSTEEEFLEALDTDCDIITLCNMSDDLIERVCSFEHNNKKIKISGNIPIGKIRTFGLMGIDYISIDCLSHASKALDITFKFLKKTFR